MRGYIAALVAASVMSCGVAVAADLPTTKAPRLSASAAAPSGWQFTATIPMWLTAIDGNVGVGQLADLERQFQHLRQSEESQSRVGGRFHRPQRHDSFSASTSCGRRSARARRSSSTAMGRSRRCAAAPRPRTRRIRCLATAFAGYRLPVARAGLALYGTVGARYTGLGPRRQSEPPGLCRRIPAASTSTTSRASNGSIR